MTTRARLPWPVLCLITDRRLAERCTLEEVVAAAVTGGVNLVQLREKDLGTRDLLDLARRLQAAIDGRAALLINGRADVAFAAGADGAHLPSDGLPAEAVRRVLGDDAVVGQAIHDPAEAASARDGDVDYLMLGTVFPSRSHPDGAAIGLSAVERAAAGTVPILAVGGIEPGNAGRVIAAGAHGVAVISSILAAPDPTEAARRLKAEVREAWARRTETSLAGSR